MSDRTKEPAGFLLRIELMEILPPIRRCFLVPATITLPGQKKMSDRFNLGSIGMTSANDLRVRPPKVDAVKLALAEDAEDLAAFKERAHEPNMTFEDVKDPPPGV